MAGPRAAIAFFLLVNLVLFAIVSSTTDVAHPRPSTTLPKPNLPSTGGKGKGKCSIDALKLKVCANVLGHLNLVHLGLGVGTPPPKSPCCPLIHGLVDLDAAVCLCTAIKANILGIKLNVPVSLSLLLNYCGNKLPSGFKCK